MKPVNDGLFAHIKESLTEHEEAYSPGAWERFNKKEGKRAKWPWFAGLGSAAAALLIGFAVFFAVPDHVPQKPVRANVDKPRTGMVGDVAPRVNHSGDMVEKLKIQVAENKNIVQQRTGNNVVNSPLIVAGKSALVISPAVVLPTDSTVQPKVTTAADNSLVAGSTNAKAIVTDSSAIAKEAVKAPMPGTDNPVRSFQDFLNAEVKANGALAAAKPGSKKADKWEMGLVIAPSIGNSKKINMGYGVSMGYALSDKVSISSGISYNEMGASKSVTGSEGRLNSPSTMALVSDTKSLESVDANLVGIDIPIGIKYYLTKKFYTNLGVSAFAVLNQKQNNNYLQGAVEHAAADPANVNGFNAVFKTRTVSELVPSEELRDDKYIGFYNISFGYQQKISGSKAFSVEPFLKLPMREFTKENLYLMGTGLRLKFDF